MKIEPILLEMVRTTCYVISNKVMCSYYKGECTLDSLSVAYFCANGAVFNWCSYLLEEFLIACEEVQEKGDTFMYGYLLLYFTMLKWMATHGKTASTLQIRGALQRCLNLGMQGQILRIWNSIMLCS
jgi:hypothetical protein